MEILVVMLLGAVIRVNLKNRKAFFPFFILLTLLTSFIYGECPKVKLSVEREIRGTHLVFPSELFSDDEGNIYIVDGGSGGFGSPYKLLKFSKNGKFKGNLLRRGQGPGEVLGINGILYSHGRIHLYDSTLRKLLIINTDGSLSKEIKIKTSVHLELVSHFRNSYLFLGTLPYYFVPKTGYYYRKNYLYKFEEGMLRRTGTYFPTKIYTVVRGASRAFFPLERILIFNFKNFLLVNHTNDYYVKIYDVEKGKVLCSLHRRYRKIKKSFQDDSYIILKGEKFYPPQKKWLEDVQRLLMYKDMILIFTSTVSKDGVRVDKFNLRGEYLGCGFLKFKYPINWEKKKFKIYVKNRFLYSIEEDESGDYSILKYKLPLWFLAK